ncbi:hypothetical protein [Solicola gregarius]|uniref:Uncharacterized protein n=1 Tax=Solicola gregarius TaxID=2908642 RepID=A0AA46TII2_9ACTN|nr:hypothetical protein [Solicola gregarius]UYM05462.1 hypothetical protein L0C25_23630 [Solicola gregarius]
MTKRLTIELEDADDFGQTIRLVGDSRIAVDDIGLMVDLIDSIGKWHQNHCVADDECCCQFRPFTRVGMDR